MTKGNLGPAFWCFLWTLSNIYAASLEPSGPCPEAASRLLSTSVLPLFEDLARERGVGKELFDRVAPQSFEFRRDGFPTGEKDGAVIFKMGNEREGIREVKLTRPFEMQATQVTQLQYFLAMGHNPSGFVDLKTRLHLGGKAIYISPNRPVETVSWGDAHRFVEKLNRLQSDYTYDLPTEAEWEFAARGGSDTRYWYGDSVKLLDFYAWFEKNSNLQTQPVAWFPHNSLGIYDAHGNVWEWTKDWFDDLPAGAMIDPTGPASGSSHVIKGGAWSSYAWYMHSGYRSTNGHPDHGVDFVGFRVIRRPRKKETL